jgi:hypothetical protein
MEFLTADVRALHDQLPPSSFDVALDKGCLDAIFSRCAARFGFFVLSARILNPEP